MRIFPRRRVLFLLIGFSMAAAVRAQDACQAPSFMLPDKSPNAFSERQEADLGDAIAESVQREYRVIDDVITGNLERIGKRLLDQLPQSNIPFRFLIVDYPEVNAFSFPGGRVYVTRKLIAATRSEDELAGVVAHEIGHIVTRQSAADLTRAFKKLLGIQSFGDRKDIFEKYNRLLDNMNRNPRAIQTSERDSDAEQIVADRVSVYLSKRAGYRPEANAEFWDRLTETGGKTGSALSDFFALTKPEQKRLREMRRLAQQLPAACAGMRAEPGPQNYEEWKTSVLNYSGLGNRETLPNAERKQLLQPRLRSSISYMRFSGDGKYLLAQDASSIFVLSRNPFEFRFRIDARDASAAQFTPDSKSIVFHTTGMRVETWSVPEERRVSLKELTITEECLQTSLSPDGRRLVCMNDDLTTIIFETEEGRRIFERKAESFASPLHLYILALNASLGRTLESEFSPDGRYFVGKVPTQSGYLAYDFAESKELKLPPSIRDLLSGSYSFMSNGRLVGTSGKAGEKSAVVSFPEGQVQYTMQTGIAGVDSVTNGDYVIIRPIDKYPAGIMDLAQKKIVVASKQSAIDVYDKTFASERLDGILSLLHVEQESVLGNASLPLSPLPRLRAISLSADMNWLALSSDSRGAVWDLRSGKQVLLARNFQGAQFAPDNTLLVDFPKAGQEERMIARIDPAGPSAKIALPLKDSKAHQAGLYLLERKDVPVSGKNRTEPGIVISSAETGRELWTHTYPLGLPSVSFSLEDDKVVLGWPAMSAFVREESKKDRDLKSKTATAKEKYGDYYLHILRASTGEVISKIYVETGIGSFRVRGAETFGDYLVLSDTQNRLLVYSISSIKRLGQVFGVNGSVSTAMQVLAAENERGIVTLYSLPSMEKLGDLVFSSPLSYMKFSKDGKQLFVLTADQQSYLFNTEAVISEAKPAIAAELR